MRVNKAARRTQARDVRRLCVHIIRSSLALAQSDLIGRVYSPSVIPARKAVFLMNGRARPTASADASPALWRATLEALRDRVPKPHLDCLADGLPYVDLSESTLRMAVPLDALRAWLRQGTLVALCDVVATLSDGACEVCVLPVDDDGGALATDPTHRLDSFLRSPSNQGAWKIARQITSGVLPPPGPIVFCGPEGSGKSHLLGGIAHALGERNVRVVGRGARRLSHKLIEALWTDRLTQFREGLLECDALILDSVETLAGRDGTQDELARAILARASRGRLVVLAVRLERGSLPPLGSGLRAALERGTVVDLAAPEWELRVALLMRRAARWGVDLSPDAASFLVGRLGADLAGVDALLTRLMARTGGARDLSTVTAVQRALEPPAPDLERALPIGTILGLVSRHFGLRMRDLYSTSRSPRISLPRQVAMYLVRRHCGLSFPEIGRRFGRHHTTVIHACRRAEELLEGTTSGGASIRLVEKEIERVRSEGG
jgi:chromosomal replication initiator protein